MSEVKENKMGVMSVPKLLINMSLPMMISMMVQALYNVVDSIFVARISEEALTAVSLAFPIQSLMISVSSGTAVGVNALLSRSLGEKNFEQSDKAANNSIVLAVISYVLFLVIGIFGTRPFFATQTTDPLILESGVSYLSIVCMCSFGLFMQIMLERLLQSTGRTFYSMITQGTGAIINIIFDPLLIFGIGIFPKLGVAGAAIATVFGQIVAMCLAIFFNLHVNKEIHFSVKAMKLDPKTVGAIYAVGVPSILMMSIGSIMTYGMNKILMAFTATAAAVFGVYFKLQSFFFMPVFGLNSGIVPIIAFNYGARKKERIMQAVKLGIGAAFCMMFVGFIVFQTIPEKLLLMFAASDDMLAIGTVALRAISWHFMIASFCIIIGSVFQALGNGVYSLIVSVGRQLVILLPAAWLLANYFGLDAVWWSFLIAEFMSFILSSTLFLRIYNKKIKPLEVTE